MNYPEEQEPIPRWQALYRFGYQALRKVYRFGYQALRKVYRAVLPFFYTITRTGYQFGLREPPTLTLRRVKVKKPTGKLPSVSIIMPFHNRPEFLAEAIESALASQYVDLELILVDDKSEPEARTIAQKYSDLYPNVRYIRLPASLGAYVARNIGMSAATSEYISFLDSDDRHDSLRLAKQVSVLRSHPKVMVSLCSGERFLNQFSGERFESVELVWISMVFSRTVLNELGFFDSVRAGGDSEFLHRVTSFKGDKSISILRESLYEIRLSQSSLTSSGDFSLYPEGDIAKERGSNLHRLEYSQAFKLFHNQADNLYVQFPEITRTIPYTQANNVVDVYSKFPTIIIASSVESLSRSNFLNWALERKKSPGNPLIIIWPPERSVGQESIGLEAIHSKEVGQMSSEQILEFLSGSYETPTLATLVGFHFGNREFKQSLGSESLSRDILVLGGPMFMIDTLKCEAGGGSSEENLKLSILASSPKVLPLSMLLNRAPIHNLWSRS
jgi:glycosyltransferase involved in cell wall biosynthesis